MALGEGWEGDVEGGGDGAEEFGFLGFYRTVGGDDLGGGDQRALLDRTTRVGEFFERFIERGVVAGAFVKGEL